MGPASLPTHWRSVVLLLYSLTFQRRFYGSHLKKVHPPKGLKALGMQTCKGRGFRRGCVM